MKLHRRQLILTSLVLALGAAVYLNWHFSDDKGLAITDVIHSEKELGEARYVNNSKTADENNSSQIESVINMTEETKEYFAKAKLERQKSRDESIETIKKILANSQSDEQAKSEAERQTENITKAIEQESNIENLIKAKGFGECMAFIQNGECSIIVNPGNLNDSSVITIRDIVSGQSGIPFEKIKIIEAK